VDALADARVPEDGEAAAVIEDVNGLSFEMPALDQAGDEAPFVDAARGPLHLGHSPHGPAGQGGGFLQVGGDEFRAASEDLEKPGGGGSFDERSPRARPEHRIHDPRDGSVRGKDAGDRPRALEAADHADLDPGEPRFFPEGTVLAPDEGRGQEEGLRHPGRILGRDRRQDPESLEAEAREDADVQARAGSSRGIIAGDGQQVCRHALASPGGFYHKRRAPSSRFGERGPSAAGGIPNCAITAIWRESDP
jgi:hypothetical protein